MQALRCFHFYELSSRFLDIFMEWKCVTANQGSTSEFDQWVRAVLFCVRLVTQRTVAKCSDWFRCEHIICDYCERLNLSCLHKQKHTTLKSVFFNKCYFCYRHTYPLVDDIEYNLMVSARFPFNYQTPTRYYIFYVIILIIFNFTSLFVMVNDLIMQAYLMHLLCQYTVLSDCFETIIYDCIDGNYCKVTLFTLFKRFLYDWL